MRIARSCIRGSIARGNPAVSLAAPVYFAFSIKAARMDAERLNTLTHTLADLTAREGELRRYL
jgi:hypothetical protein